MSALSKGHSLISTVSDFPPCRAGKVRVWIRNSADKACVMVELLCFSGSQGWHKDSCRSPTGAAALWSHFKGVILEHFGGCFQNSMGSWISLQVQQFR